jgi:hypothetical protein
MDYLARTYASFADYIADQKAADPKHDLKVTVSMLKS